MKKLITFAAMMAGAVVMTGCSTTPQNLIASSKPVLQGRYTVLGDEVEGTDTQVMLLGFALGLPGSPQQRALKAALDKAAGSDALIEMSVDYQVLNLWWAHIMTTRITGTPVKTSSIGTK